LWFLWPTLCMIYYDTTKMGARGTLGLMRLSSRIRESWVASSPSAWDGSSAALCRKRRERFIGAADWLLTVEQFCETDRPDSGRSCRTRPAGCGDVSRRHPGALAAHHLAAKRAAAPGIHEAAGGLRPDLAISDATKRTL